MKKILLILALAALPSALFAQGYVAFANTSTTHIRTNTTSLPGGAVGSMDGAGQWRIALYIAPSGETLESAFTLAVADIGNAPSTTTNTFGALGRGRFNGGNPFAIDGNGGTAIAFQVRAWSASFATYELAKEAWDLGTPGVLVGRSTIGSVTPGIGGSPTPSLFGVGAGQIGGFDMVPGVPEPSSIALGLLGLGAIALFRRRK